MSKSGLFAHFGSKEELQVATIKAARERFIEEVFRPALNVERGYPRLMAICRSWIDYLRRGVFPGGLAELRRGLFLIEEVVDDLKREAGRFAVAFKRRELLIRCRREDAAEHDGRGDELGRFVLVDEFELFEIRAALQVRDLPADHPLRIDGLRDDPNRFDASGAR